MVFNVFQLGINTLKVCYKILNHSPRILHAEAHAHLLISRLQYVVHILHINIESVDTQGQSKIGTCTPL